MNTFIITNICYCDVPNVISINIFVRTYVYFSRSESNFSKKQLQKRLCILYKNCILFHNHLKLYYKSFHFRQYFNYILQLICQLIFSNVYNFHNLNTLQYHMIYYICNHKYQDSK